MIGRALRARLTERGDVVRVLVRREPRGDDEYRWTGQVGSAPAAAVDWAEAVVSLNGAPIARLPWTNAYRRQIMSSRVETAAALALAITEAANPPAVWVSASATGFYGDRGRRGDAAAAEPVTEADGSGRGFLAGVVRAWEAAAAPAGAVTRLVRARTGIVLAPAGGTLAPLIRTTRLGLGARFGSGRQYWPWISLRDEVRAWDFALRDERLAGPVNLVGPALATAGQITAELARALGRPHWLAVPAFALRLALDGAADDLILASQPIRPAALQACGFEFVDPTAAAAIRWAVARPPLPS